MKTPLSFCTGLALGTLALSAAAESADLRVYTYDSFVSEWGPGPQIESAFEAQCDCDLEFIAVEDGVSILNRLRIEREGNKADVILGIDDALIEETRATSLIAPHALDLSGLKAELNWHDSDFVPFDYGYFAFIYDSTRVGQPVDSLRALIESDASVIYQDPRTSTPGQGLMLWVKSVYGDDAAAAWTRLASHTVTVTKGWWEAYSLFLEGDADYVLSYSTSPAYHQVAEGKNQYRAAAFSEGHVAQIEVGAITRNAQDPELARRFLQFLISAEAQAIIPVTNWMLPVVDDVELPDAFDSLIRPERIGFTPQQVEQSRRDWLREWRSAASR
ncbi:thiamine transporter substrate binding subunit [Marinobacterium nitratireducens]|uniref:Thiamine transporter substrate binding subunit n=1 Tax=Marinobacterium nitratireducens TaxID=518897 RepID=A0A918DNW3_9GAMM|nr:thiamine ABC transporter substrate binding subunit [Marinobacterium nitratireducens]GGO75462.1 thiamine transporter substrate binding subunit [Marinobacterium nitratireducens]